jgi:hypothetical protein
MLNIMAKDPAFLFYSSDFLSGVTDLTMEERGQYITLLCLQHQKGALSEKTIRLSVGSVSVDVLSKFEKDEDGNFYNKRLFSEIEKRAFFTQSRRNNGVKGGRPKKDKKPNGKPYAKPNGKPTKNHMGNENENEIIVKDDDMKGGAGGKQKLNFGSLQDSFSEQWSRWVKFKKEQHNFVYKSQDSEQEAINELIKLSTGDCVVAEKIIKQSIAKSWKGLFDLKESINNDKSTSGNIKEPRVGRVPESGIRSILDCEIPVIFKRNSGNGGNDG